MLLWPSFPEPTNMQDSQNSQGSPQVNDWPRSSFPGVSRHGPVSFLFGLLHLPWFCEILQYPSRTPSFTLEPVRTDVYGITILDHSKLYSCVNYSKENSWFWASDSRIFFYLIEHSFIQYGPSIVCNLHYIKDIFSKKGKDGHCKVCHELRDHSLGKVSLFLQ